MSFMKEPIMLVSRQNSRNLLSSPTRPQAHVGSKLIAALDAMDLQGHETCMDDSDVELIGSPMKATRRIKPKLPPIQGRSGATIHPFFQKKSPKCYEPENIEVGRPKSGTSLPAILLMSKAPVKGSTEGGAPRRTTHPKSASSSKGTVHISTNPQDRPLKGHGPESLDVSLPVIPPMPKAPAKGSAFKSTHIKPASSLKDTPTTRHPKYTYKDYSNPRPCLVYTQHEEETDDLVNSLAPGPLAFDMEWRVFFQNPRSAHPVAERKTAVVQVADTRGLILVIQVYHMSRFPKSLIALLENPDIPKLGVNILNDGKKLFRDYGILARNLVELGAVAAKAESGGASIEKHGRTMVSLAKLVEKYCDKTLEKGKERMGNWEAELSASSSMVEYAANDVHSTMMILARLEELAAANSNIPANTTPTSILAGIAGANVKREDCPPASAEEEPNSEMRPQYIRAYRCWHDRGMSLDKMCIDLRVNKMGGADAPGLKRGTIISYIISALQADEKLPFEMPRLLELVQMDLGSWSRHRQWLLSKWTRA